MKENEEIRKATGSIKTKRQDTEENERYSFKELLEDLRLEQLETM